MLAKKLKLKPGQTLLLINGPHEYEEMLGEPEQVKITRKRTGEYDHVHLFVNNKYELDKFYLEAIDATKMEGLLWISYPKKTSKTPTDLTRDDGWDKIMNHKGLKFNTLISFDDTWSAFALRKSDKQDSIKKKSAHEAELLNQYIDSKNRIITLPEDLKKLLSKNKSEEAFFNSLSFTNKKEYVIWIIGAKQEETRARRLGQIIDRLSRQLKNPSAK